MKTLALMIGMCGLMVCSRAMADDKADVSKSVKEVTTNIVAILNDDTLELDASKEKVQVEIEKIFDFPLTAKLTLGRTYWPKLTPEQQKDFQELFVKNIINSYYDKAKQFATETIIYGDPENVGNKIQMLISFVSKGEKITINNKLYKSKTGWMIYDMEIQDVSIVRSYGSQYTEVLKNGSGEDLLEKMRAKLKDVKKAEEAEEKTDDAEKKAEDAEVKTEAMDTKAE